MRPFSSFPGMPRAGLVIALPVGVFLIAAALSLGSGSGGEAQPTPTLAVSVLASEPIQPTAAQATQAAANRADCAKISGTPYQSDTERQWFLANCLTSATAAPSAANSNPIRTSSSPQTPSSPPPVTYSGGDTPMGDRIVIPAAGVNASVYRSYVPASAAALPNPVGYFYAVWYDLSEWPGYGGYVEGNMVLAGHVDCAACHNGSPGAAVFYYIRNLTPGATIDYYTADGRVFHYRVTSVVAYPRDVNVLPLISSSYADMTLITCSGTWNAAIREYSDRTFVFAELI